MPVPVPLPLPVLIALVAAASACGPEPTPTRTVCPPAGTALTYDNFGKPFMERYCTDCHASDVTGDDRKGAPPYHDFDTLGGILAVGDHVDWWAGAGPAAENTLMPNEEPFPTLAERYQLSEWLACELEDR